MPASIAGCVERLCMRQSAVESSIIVEISRFHLLTRKKANKKRKVAVSPDFASCRFEHSYGAGVIDGAL